MDHGTNTATLEKISNITIEPWNVILLNDDYHSIDEVIYQLKKAVPGKVEMWYSDKVMEVHKNNSAKVFTGSKERCELVVDILEEIRLRTQLEKA